MGLQQYHAKRDFRRTAEPKGKVPASKGKQAGGLFVMHKHAARRLHYDLRLEHGGVLWSWAVTRGPSLDPSEKRLAVHVEDHPLDYGSFEGVIPKGQYGAGAVVIWDEGTWEPEGDPESGMRKGHLKFELRGKKLHGAWHLVRLKPRPGEKGENWLLIKSEDEFANPARDILEEEQESVKSGLTVEEVEQGKKPKRKAKTKSASKMAKLPGFIEPCLARLQDKPPPGSDWVHEVKFDGYRIQAHISEGDVKLLTRKGLDWTHKFGKGIHGELAALDCHSAVIDGEIVVLGANGATSFADLQLALSENRTGDMILYLFDLLWLNGADLRSEPLLERKQKLRALLGKSNGQGQVHYSEHFTEPGQTVFDHACRMELEGVVSKRVDAPYRSGRGHDWIKTKCVLREEFIILGYLPSDKTGRGIRSLIVGRYDRKGGKLIPNGNVGTGFSMKIARDLKKRLDGMKVNKPTVTGEAAAQKGAVWVTPELVAQIEFRTWTHGGSIRHASFLGLREDKPAEEVVMEQEEPPRKAPTSAVKKPDGKAAPAPKTSVALTNPGKTLWPEDGVTKQDLLDHYALVWPRMRQFVVDRPLALVRAPDGIDRQRFFQKHSMPGMHKSILKSRDPEDDEEVLYIRDFDGLAALVQMGVVEVHIWGSKEKTIGLPDQVVFDLDPDEGLGVEDVRAAAIEVRDRLEELGFATYVKTSGGKGFHVIIPLKPKADWDEVKTFAHDFARAMAQAEPKRYTATLSKKARTGRIFIDYLRNGRGSTTVAPWSSRAKKGATVSVPVTWEMVEGGIGPADFRIGHPMIEERLAAEDPWADFFKKAKPLNRR